MQLGCQLVEKYFNPKKPTKRESEVINNISKIINKEFHYLRLTKTMLIKSIIDASQPIRDIFSKNSIIDYDLLGQGKSNRIIIDNGILILPEKIIETKVSLYRPITKKGDPRFWPYNMKKYLKQNQLIIITTKDQHIVIIPVIRDKKLIQGISSYFQNDDASQIKFLQEKLSPFCRKWIDTKIKNIRPKDLGTIIESEVFGVKTNSSRKADIDGKIEVKTTRISSNKTSLWSQVPDWSISKFKSAKDIILKYGYDSVEHPGFKDLYVTVGNKPNRQGLYFDIHKDGLDSDLVNQYNSRDGAICTWNKKDLKDRLFKKFPAAVWIKPITKSEKGTIWYNIDPDKNKILYTSSPIFSQFIHLIGDGTINFDWRGKVKPDGTKYRDHGHGFRIQNGKEKELFHSEKELIINSF